MPTRSVTVSRRSRSLDTMITVRAAGALLGAQELEDLLRRDRIEPRRRLVVEDDRRARDRGARDADPLLLPAATGPPACGPRSPASATHARRSATRSASSSRGARRGGAAGRRCCRATVRWSKSALFWKSMPNRRRIFWSSSSMHPRHVVVADANRAACRAHQADDHLEEHALARRAGADEPVEAPFGHVQRHVSYDGLPARPRPRGNDLVTRSRRSTGATRQLRVRVSAAEEALQG